MRRSNLAIGPDTPDLDEALRQAAAGHHAVVVDCCLAVLGQHVDCAPAWKLMGDAMRGLGHKDKARGAYTRAIERCFVYPDAWYALATLLLELGEHADACKAFGVTLNQQPDCHVARIVRAALHFHAGRDDDARTDVALVLQAMPAHVEALVLSARIAMRRLAFDDVLQACRTALLHAPDHPTAHVVLGSLHYRLGHIAEARALLERAVALAPGLGEAHHDLGVTLKALGRFDDARAHFRQSLRIDEAMLGAYLNIADLVDFAQEPELVLQITRQLAIHCPDPRADPPETRDTRMRLHYAAAKVSEDLGDYPRALDHYREGGRLKRTTVHYDDAEHAAYCAAIKAAFCAEFMAGHGLVGDPSRAPVFIVGMPRSGSTLVEQILSCHPGIRSLGEVMALPGAIARCTARDPALPAYPHMAQALRQDHVTAMARAYLAEIAAPDGDATRITDKLLNNFFEIGLISVLFPNARIIHTLRDPVATCLSTFCALFGDKLWYSYDMAELGANYCHYIDLMEHWRAVLPAGMMTSVVYEDLVRDPEAGARHLLNAVDLPWHDGCLNFAGSRRVVQTASAAQVRKPIYTSAIDRWRRYGAGLDPLIDALRPSLGKPGGLRADHLVEGASGANTQLR